MGVCLAMTSLLLLLEGILADEPVSGKILSRRKQINTEWKAVIFFIKNNLFKDSTVMSNS
jgi:hypothetical protein